MGTIVSLFAGFPQELAGSYLAIQIRLSHIHADGEYFHFSVGFYFIRNILAAAGAEDRKAARFPDALREGIAVKDILYGRLADEMTVGDQAVHGQIGGGFDAFDFSKDFLHGIGSRAVAVDHVEHAVVGPEVFRELVQDHGAGVVPAGVHNDAAFGVLHRGEDRGIQGLEFRAVPAVVGVGVDADAFSFHGIGQLAAAEIGVFDVQVAEGQGVQGGGAVVAQGGEGVGQRDGELGLAASEVAGDDDDAGTACDIVEKVCHYELLCVNVALLSGVGEEMSRGDGSSRRSKTGRTSGTVLRAGQKTGRTLGTVLRARSKTGREEPSPTSDLAVPL